MLLMNDLTSKKCIPCETYVAPLNQEKENELLKETAGWVINREEKIHKLIKNFEFKDFTQAMQFINKVADIAESEGHHPDMFITYNKVTITLFTHFIKGLHQNDFIIAAKINKLKN